jgi:hypothetical protein
MNITEEAKELFDLWESGKLASAMLRLESIPGLLRCAVTVQLTLMIIDWDEDCADKLPEFVEALERYSFDRSELDVGDVMEG